MTVQRLASVMQPWQQELWRACQRITYPNRWPSRNPPFPPEGASPKRRPASWLYHQLKEFALLREQVLPSKEPIAFFVDEAKDIDFTAISLVEHGPGQSLIVHDVRTGRWPDERALEAVIDSMKRDHHRPRGYSRSHWRKIWKQRRSK